MYYRSAPAAIVVYDVTTYESFDRAKHWVQRLRAEIPDAILALAGNKVDLESKRAVAFEVSPFLLVRA